LLLVDAYFDEVSSVLLALYAELFADESLIELVFFVAKVVLLDEDVDSEIFPNFGFGSSTFVSFGLALQLGDFSSTLSGALAGVVGTCFFQEGSGFSGVDGAELSGVVLEGVFHDGVDGGLGLGVVDLSVSGFELCVVGLLLVDEVA